MRKRFSNLKNCDVYALDGIIGKVTDLLIEEEAWTVRYLVVEIKTSDESRRVLISPAAIEGIASDPKLIATSLGCKQILDSPPFDPNQLISRQYEKELVDYYNWPIYWLGRARPISNQNMNPVSSDETSLSIERCLQSNLRSALEICGHQIQSKNGPAGVMKDLVIKISSWTVEYGTADPNSWLPKREGSMFSTKQVESIDWPNRCISVDLSKFVAEPISYPPTTGEPFSSQPFRTA